MGVPNQKNKVNNYRDENNIKFCTIILALIIVGTMVFGNISITKASDITKTMVVEIGEGGKKVKVP